MAEKAPACLFAETGLGESTGPWWIHSDWRCYYTSAAVAAADAIADDPDLMKLFTLSSLPQARNILWLPFCCSTCNPAVSLYCSVRVSVCVFFVDCTFLLRYIWEFLKTPHAAPQKSSVYLLWKQMLHTLVYLTRDYLCLCIAFLLLFGLFPIEFTFVLSFIFSLLSPPFP